MAREPHDKDVVSASHPLCMASFAEVELVGGDLDGARQVSSKTLPESQAGARAGEGAEVGARFGALRGQLGVARVGESRRGKVILSKISAVVAVVAHALKLLQGLSFVRILFAGCRVRHGQSCVAKNGETEAQASAGHVDAGVRDKVGVGVGAEVAASVLLLLPLLGDILGPRKLGLVVGKPGLETRRGCR